jgi:hypothetical protein
MPTKYPLEDLWPFHIDTKAEWDDGSIMSKSYHFGTYDHTNDCFHLICSDAKSSTFLIPKYYKNGLRLMNAKVSFLQQCIICFSEPSPQHMAPDAKEQLSIALDSLIRNIHFTTTVRDKFLHGISRAMDRSDCNEWDQYRCPLLDAWLFCEYHWGRHNPLDIADRADGSVWKLEEGGELIPLPLLFQFLFALASWTNYWTSWNGNSKPEYWGPPPGPEEEAAARSLGIPSEPTLEMVPLLDSIKKHKDEVIAGIQDITVSHKTHSSIRTSANAH